MKKGAKVPQIAKWLLAFGTNARKQKHTKDEIEAAIKLQNLYSAYGAASRAKKYAYKDLVKFYEENK